MLSNIIVVVILCEYTAGGLLETVWNCMKKSMCDPSIYESLHLMIYKIMPSKYCMVDILYAAGCVPNNSKT